MIIVILTSLKFIEIIFTFFKNEDNSYLCPI